MSGLLCRLGWHRWVVDVPEHALAALRSGRVVLECARPGCDVWRLRETTP